MPKYQCNKKFAKQSWLSSFNYLILKKDFV
jgi:hypothetical protein